MFVKMRCMEIQIGYFRQVTAEFGLKISLLIVPKPNC